MTLSNDDFDHNDEMFIAMVVLPQIVSDLLVELLGVILVMILTIMLMLIAIMVLNVY